MIDRNDPKLKSINDNFKFKSQNNEDAILIEMLNGKRNGVIVDVGAADGMSGSNSFKLINEYDWKGLLIEPRSSNFNTLKYLYTSNTNVVLENVAVSNTTKTATLYLKDAAGCNCLREPETKREGPDPHHGGVGDDIGTEQVQVVTLNSLLKKHNIKEIDVLTIDTEGNDLAVLQGLDFNEYKPRIIIVEYAPLVKIRTRRDEFEEVIGPDYKFVKDVGGNFIFTL